MGKNLKGKEIGTGLSRRRDGKYSARFSAGDGSRQEKYFNTLPKARNWLADAKYEDKHGIRVSSPEMTVDAWLQYRIENIVCNRAPNTIRNYRERYKRNVQPILGKMRMMDVRPMYCSAVLNRMDTEYAGSTIRQTN